VKTFSFYDPATGLFTGRTFSCDIGSDAVRAKVLATNTPAGLKSIEGLHDHLRSRVDATTGAVVDYQPPQPSPDYEWDATKKKWVLNATAQAKQSARAAALATIATLESKQPRAVRESTLGVVGGRERLQAIETQIEALRAKL
jgi:hypothetical protein